MISKHERLFLRVENLLDRLNRNGLNGLKIQWIFVKWKFLRFIYIKSYYCDEKLN